jgi:hypothetical protein
MRQRSYPEAWRTVLWTYSTYSVRLVLRIQHIRIAMTVSVAKSSEKQTTGMLPLPWTRASSPQVFERALAIPVEVGNMQENKPLT